MRQSSPSSSSRSRGRAQARLVRGAVFCDHHDIDVPSRRDPVHIDIVSDVICPWCYIGKRRLARALDQRPDLSVSITWRAFQLNPEMPAGGMLRADYVAAKFGGAAHAARIYAAIA